MQNGLYGLNPPSFEPLRSRGELDSDGAQALLRRHHRRPGTLCCGCGLDLGLRLMLTPREVGGRLTAVRDDVQEHVPGCILERGGDAFIGKALRSSRLFAPLESPVPRVHREDRAAWALMMRAHDTFSTYARRLMSKGATDAFLALNTVRGESREPYVTETAADVFRSVHDAILGFEFLDAQDGYAAARLSGARLRFGLVVERPVVRREQAVVPLNVAWWEDGWLVHELTVARADAMAAAIADLEVFGTEQAPPYFVVAVQDADGTLRRLCLHLVHCDERHLVYVESRYEANFAAALLRLGYASLKPIRLEDIERALRTLGIAIPAGFRWTYRPDFLAFSQAKDGRRRLHVREIRGFRPGANHSYDDTLARKSIHYEALAAKFGWEYQCRNGWELERVDSSCEPLFRSFPAAFEPPAPAFLRIA